MGRGEETSLYVKLELDDDNNTNASMRRVRDSVLLLPETNWGFTRYNHY